jgi:glucokinase
VYDFLVAREPAAERPSTRERMASEDPGAVVGQLGVGGEDPMCARAVDLFCGLYGAEAGNLALKTLPTGGVYLAGGIALHLLPRLRTGFLPGFLAKGRMSSVLARMPVGVVLDAEVALRGAALAAAALIPPASR